MKELARRYEKVLITGGTHGIGKAIAEQFASCGYEVCITGRNVEAGDEVTKNAKEKYRESMHFIPCEMQDTEQIKNAVAQAVQKMDRIDILVNNAGIYPAAPLLEMTEEDFDRVFRVNVWGAFEMAREAAKQSMIPCKGGKLIFVSSVDGWLPSAGIAAYAASKAAVNSLVKSFAIELSPYGIHANGIAPGWVATETVLKAGRWKSQMDSVLEKRMADPEEIGKAIIALCTESFDYMDGEVLNFSGGLIMNA
ncbi:SDR family oxidoreductase [Lachnospiraceae bacterium Oil+RF-744-WCA-WT-13]|uniref:SDR family oxidoreductase n=1 Tax=Bilifractor porci TaxID=2606636 RepID=A0A7X2TMJ9_9FIRM|nr:SDR family oxidoreductase [Bilifractor porci]